MKRTPAASNNSLSTRWESILIRHQRLLAVGCAFLLHSGAIWNDYIDLDDREILVGFAAFLSNPANLLAAFTTDFHLTGQGGYYRPLTLVSFMLESLLGMGAGGRHFTNLLLHCLNTSLVCSFLSRFGGKTLSTCFASVVFAVHPAAATAVGWVTTRNDLLATVFILLTFLLLLRYIEKPAFLYVVVGAGASMCAFMAKEAALPLGFACLAIAVRQTAPGRIRNQICLVWFSVYAAGVGAFFLLRANALDAASMSMESPQRIIERLPALVQILGKLTFPFNLNAIPTLTNTSWIPGAAAMLLWGAAFWRSDERHKRTLLLAAIIALIFILPGFAGKGPPIHYFFENRNYPALVGLALALSSVRLQTIWSKERQPGWLPSAAVVVLSATLAVFSIRSGSIYRNPTHFWSSAEAHSADHPLVWLKKGQSLMDAGQYDGALQALQKAEAISPKEPMVQNNIGAIFLRTGRPAEAVSRFEREIELNPRHHVAYLNRGIAAYQLGDMAAAEAHWRKAIALNPREPSQYELLYNFLGAQQRYAEMEEVLRARRRAGL